VPHDIASMVLASGMGGKAMAMWILIAVIVVVLGGGSVLYSAQTRKKRAAEAKGTQLKG
jgi:flagellar basal body-associated protein FliL